jgi:hypothetical protein
MLAAFAPAPSALRGWQLHAEHWSPETLEQLQGAGARIFASRYSYGLRSRTALQEYLDVHGRALERTDDWFVYALEPAAASTTATR